MTIMANIEYFCVLGTVLILYEYMWILIHLNVSWVFTLNMLCGDPLIKQIIPLKVRFLSTWFM